MSSDPGSHQHHLRPQSIPLRDLSRPPDTSDDDGRGAGNRRSFGLGRKGSFLGSRQPFRGRVNTAGRYERVVEDSPDRGDPNLPHITTPRNVHRPTSYEDGEVSPVNPGDFQVAMGSVGLSFENTAPAPSPGPSTTSSARRGSTLNVINETDFSNPFTSSITRVDSEEQYFSPTENDTTPLTDRRLLQPMSGVPASASTGWRHDRSKSRLGDDLPTAEAGLRPPSTYSTGSGSGRRSSGSTSPLSRAGTIVRKMSQRVVNLSNEPEIVEQSIRRQPSTRQARLEGPPSFPALVDYAPNEPRTPLEKTHSTVVAIGREPDDWHQHPNPLKGKSLGLFPPDSWLRLKLCEMLVHRFTEPIILILIFVQTILLAIDAAPTLKSGKRPRAWTDAWINPALLILFIIYTLEIIARVIVSGFIKNAEDYSTVDWDLGVWRAFLSKCMNLFNPHGQHSAGHGAGKIQQQSAGPEQSILRSFTSTQGYVDKPGHTRQQQRVRLARRAFLRHGFNRLDFVAVVSFWISFVLQLLMVESNRHVYVFRMLSCLRILRLLGLTSGTSVILRSLKRATPLLVNVAFLIGFFWLLFAIVGVQSFKSSFRRSCAWYEDIGHVLTTNTSQIPYRQDSAPDRLQLCGGHLNANNGHIEPWLRADFSNGSLHFSKGRETPKGYICPKGSLCLEGKNPYNGTVSFDNVLQSLQLVFVIMSSNTFSDLLYYTTDADYLAGAIFFAFGIVVMSLWLMNLLVAVITSSFQIIREESKTSAFAADEEQIHLPEIEDDEESEKIERITSLKRNYNKFYWVWIIIIIFGLVVQSLRSADMSAHRGKIIDKTELVVTILLVLEIFLRFFSDWHNFHKSPRNWIDLALAVITAVIQIPQIHRSREVYAWLTIFQILRIYRVVLAVSLTRQLIVSQ